MTVDGEVHVCSRESNPELFYAVIGGLGLIGFILDVEYRLIRVGETPKYRSHGMVFDGINGLEHLFLDTKLGTAPEPEQWHGSSAILYGRGDKRFSIINRHCFEETDKTQPCILHAHSKTRLAADLLLRVIPWIAPTMWDMYRHLARRSPHNTRRYWDDPYEALFFMETNYEGKKLVNTLGLDFHILQQSFTVPCTGDRTRDLERAKSFAQPAMDLLDEHGITPAMIDMGLMPVSEAFLLSVSDGADTFVMSIAVEGFGIPEENVVRDIFTELSDICYGDYGGKIHLTKNMHCREALIDEMYGDKLREFRRIKHKYDPDGLLISDMGRKLLGLPRSLPNAMAS
jgi:hypothetical protein